MTEKRGKGKGSADWQKIVDASVPEDMAPPAKASTKGQRKSTTQQGEASPVSDDETSAPTPRPLIPTPPPPRARPQRKQFNNRIRIDLIERVKDEQHEWEERGYQRTQADILEDALNLYYATKDETQ